MTRRTPIRSFLFLAIKKLRGVRRSSSHDTNRPTHLGEEPFLRRLLSEWNITDRSDDALLCLSELATNAVCHGGSEGEHFDVEVSCADGRLRVEVRDLTWRKPRMKWPTPDDTAGRGLLLVDALADGWGVEPCVPCGKSVWTEFKIEARQELPTGGNPC